jgi:hypothetical protein
MQHGGGPATIGHFWWNSLMPNHSLNRTFCGARALGENEMKPKARAPQNAG